MAVNFAALNTVYNHYLTSYAPKGSSPYDTHKKSELRSIYNTIVKMNKEAPLYILDTSSQTQAFAVGIKEGARNLRNTIASLGGLDEGELLNKKAAYSSNEAIASAKYVGSAAEPDDAPSFDIEVHALATQQSNMGNFLESGQSAALQPDTYSFDINIQDLNYEFQFNINAGDTNRDVQERLSRLIDHADIGLESEVIEDAEGQSALVIRSQATGLDEGRTALFSVSDTHTSKSAGSVDYLGIDKITTPASNASFSIGTTLHSASSNTFSVEKVYELTLNGISPSEGETASIGLKTDVESLAENVGHLLGSYNEFIKAASSFSPSHTRSQRLLAEINTMSSYYRNTLESVGIQLGEEGSLTLDKNVMRESMLNGDVHELFTPVKEFTNSILRKSNQIALNPMEYTDRTIVAYKNPGKNFATPYITSAYSGMMFNGYC